MPGVLLAVQLPQDVDRAVAGVHVEDPVHVGASVEGVPAAQHTGGGKKSKTENWGGVSIHYSIQYVYIVKHFIEHV